MAHHILEYDKACTSCSATGIYVGLAERDGAGVVCHVCHGTGHCHVRIKYDDFDGRVPRTDVVRVQLANPGIIVGPEIAEFGGLSYDSWVSGAKLVPGTEDRRHTCPAWWYQCADYEFKPHWDECVGAGCFSGCTQFSCKSGCWERWDQEFGQAAIAKANANPAD